MTSVTRIPNLGLLTLGLILVTDRNISRMLEHREVRTQLCELSAARRGGPRCAPDPGPDRTVCKVQ